MPDRSDSVPTLVQFRASHYNEKARWGLDAKGVAHRRRTLLPGFHRGALRKLGARQLPVLILDGEAIEDSSRILAALEERWPERPLLPQDPAERQRALALEDWLDEEVGPVARHAMFCRMLDHPRFIASLFAGDRGGLAQRAYAAAIGLQRRTMVRAMELTPEAFERSVARLEQSWARLEAEIQPSGYLVGSRFGLADLTAAALHSILVFPDAWRDAPTRPPPESVQEFVAANGRRPGGRWVREIYRKHRGESAALP